MKKNRERSQPNANPPSHEGPDRRNPQTPDRRARPRGGRRATDTFRKLADFAYKLLTEPPR